MGFVSKTNRRKVNIRRWTQRNKLTLKLISESQMVPRIQSLWCQGFGLNKARWLFWVTFDHYLKQCISSYVENDEPVSDIFVYSWVCEYKQGSSNSYWETKIPKLSARKLRHYQTKITNMQQYLKQTYKWVVNPLIYSTDKPRANHTKLFFLC